MDNNFNGNSNNFNNSNMYNNANVNDYYYDPFVKAENSTPNYNTYSSDTYYAETQKSPCSWACIAGFVLSLVGFIFNPLGLVSIIALIFGIIGHSHKGPKMGFGIAAWIIAIISFLCQLIVDSIITLFSFGLGIFCFLF